MLCKLQQCLGYFGMFLGSDGYAVPSLTLDHQNPNIGIPKGEASLSELTVQVRVPKNAKSLPREGILSKIQACKSLYYFFS